MSIGFASDIICDLFYESADGNRIIPDKRVAYGASCDAQLLSHFVKFCGLILNALFNKNRLRLFLRFIGQACKNKTYDQTEQRGRYDVPYPVKIECDRIDGPRCAKCYIRRRRRQLFLFRLFNNAALSVERPVRDGSCAALNAFLFLLFPFNV